MRVYDKRTENLHEVYDIYYDSNGYPHFLIYNKNQWLRVSAKHFVPEQECCFETYRIKTKISDVPEIAREFLMYE